MSRIALTRISATASSFAQNHSRYSYPHRFHIFALPLYLLLICFINIPAISAAKVENLSVSQDFHRFIPDREDVWIILFNVNYAIPSFLDKVAQKLNNLVRVGFVDCTKISGQKNRGFAESVCHTVVHGSGKAVGRNSARKSKQRKPGSPTILAYTFDSRGDPLVATTEYTGMEGAWRKIVDWALSTTVLPKDLTVQLTGHAGTNVLHKEEFGNFLKHPRTAKAMFFTTSGKGDPPPLVRALSMKFRQRMLVGEVKASDTTLRKAFNLGGAKDVPRVVVTDTEFKRHVFPEKSSTKMMTRPNIESFLQKFALPEREQDLHTDFFQSPEATEHVKVKRQSYSDADSAISYPHKRFNPWKVLGLKESKQIPNGEMLKKAYKAVAKQNHPDKCQEKQKKSCEDKMAEATLAQDVLSDGRKLQQWEAWRRENILGGRRSEF